MVNRIYNKQVSPKGYMKGGRVEKMGGGMMKRGMYKKGSFPDMSGDGKVTQKDICSLFVKSWICHYFFPPFLNICVPFIPKMLATTSTHKFVNHFGSS